MSFALLRFVQQNWAALAFIAVAVTAFVFLRSPATRVMRLNILDSVGK
jgi:hypothetical protein